MSCVKSAGKKFKELVEENSPLAIVGAVNAYSALQAVKVGHRALYLSGSGVASASYGLPDLGIIALEEVCIDVRRICGRVDAPLLVDCDTGFGGAFNIARTIKELIRAGAAATHIEDQVAQKRCGHRPNKELVSINEMCDRIKAAVDAKIDDDFVIMARTDAHAIEGQQRAIERALAYVEAGAQMLFAEAIHTLEEYAEFTKLIKVPVLANITEFGKTPYFSQKELASVGIKMVLYPLSANRAMNKAAVDVYKSILEKGHQKDVLNIMQTREELYEMLDYYAFENKLDELFKGGKNERK
ncbi:MULTISPECIES: methylisocitrate lyase [unclassified Campylobacter]|uniref:methylisocitrate lyase n=1 Tax=unclassified Campylobacter TaxID=2593542 RepID=UPI00123838DC|nr:MULTISPECIES: methylisocitrate lyase [unclassified Campylobacter]KAA6225031.1 methylisocitrate lyase [Campylobacter sp. LR185c]KAA6225990.1 methylisocitrate lyase [Campylobacter sp. LR196d]KAA6226065.1 methylisocitrate lyase [Campylobacter sp. LR286c]KAA6230360.1 methylisocitrate lyase [Campylobacter sp. LR264d]KAA6230985.1 methylisocitrate lyase [Campylobacter sp. LR291e]